MATAVSKDVQHFDTIILGAGMSGLACASRLFEHRFYKGKNRLKVLEGRNRIGGRINAVHMNGSRLDTGANWIHGIGTKDVPNPLMDILPHKRYKQLTGTVMFRPPSRDSKDANDDEWVKVGSVAPLERDPSNKVEDLVIPSDIGGKLMGATWSMIESLHETAASIPAEEAKNTKMLQAITQTKDFRETFAAVPEQYHHTVGTLPQFIENMEAAPLAAQSAEHKQGLPGMSLLEFGIDDFDGEQVFLQDGYIAIIDELARDLIEADVIQLETIVEKIQWDDVRIIIKTTKGTYSADDVVCTLPLGVLQHNADTIFEPPLPAEKQEAINSLGFGTLDKIFLVFKEPWWTHEPYASILKKGFVDRPFDSESVSTTSSKKPTAPDSFIGFTDELAGIEIHRDGTTSSGPRTLSLINLHNLTGFPVLSAFVSCANAAEIESMSDAQAGGVLHRALESWFGQEVPKPANVHVTRWALDEFSLGSYSHMITGLSETRHREAFQETIGPRGGLRFAGEHTSRNHFATVHGALISGRREADGLLEDLEDLSDCMSRY